MSYRGRGRGGFAYNNVNDRNNTAGFGAAPAAVEVEIFGWNGSTPGECIAFVARKCKISVTNFAINNANGALKGTVRSDQEANDLLQWSGVRFAGNALKINKVGGSASGLAANSSDGSSTIQTLTMFIKSRYNAEMKLLNLNSVQQDPTLSSKGFFGSNSTTSKFFPALMKIAGDLKLEVTSVDLSNNNLTDLSNISTLSQALPNLRNLSLQNNKISRIRAFELWKKKFPFLRELITSENPVVNTANQNDINNFKAEMLKVFPRLVVLNGEVLRNEQTLNETLKFAFDSPQPMFFSDSDVQGLSTNFITNYMNLWDTDRAGLMVLYQNESQFSVQADSTMPHSVDNKPAPDLGYYMPISRNLTRVSSAKVRATRVAAGQEQIFKMFLQLPETRHELMAKPENYSMESYRVQPLGAISITIHGKFEETAAPDNVEHVQQGSGSRNKFSYSKKPRVALGVKSFDRTFIVIPGPNSSMIVASDLLCVRAESESDVFTSAKPAVPNAPAAVPTPGASPMPQPPQAVPAPNGPTAADLPPEVKSTLNPVQQELLVKVLLETKLTMQYGYMLCQQSNWAYQECIMNFKNSASSLPPDAFTQ